MKAIFFDGVLVRQTHLIQKFLGSHVDGIEN